MPVHSKVLSPVFMDTDDPPIGTQTYPLWSSPTVDVSSRSVSVKDDRLGSARTSPTSVAGSSIIFSTASLDTMTTEVELIYLRSLCNTLRVEKGVANGQLQGMK
jgi:hypothetical protein